MGQKDDIVYGYYDDQDEHWLREHTVPTDEVAGLHQSLLDVDFEYHENDDLYW